MRIDGDSIFYQNDNLQEKEAASILGLAKCFRSNFKEIMMDETKKISDLTVSEFRELMRQIDYEKMMRSNSGPPLYYEMKWSGAPYTPYALKGRQGVFDK